MTMADSLTTYSEMSPSNLALSQDESPANADGNNFSGGSLSMDFSAPLTGQARSERVKQMANTHVRPCLPSGPFAWEKFTEKLTPFTQPAYTKMRNVQEVLCKIQTSLRRMPGVSAAESEEIIGQLQSIGQVVSQETSQLIDAIANLTLDNEQTGKHYARMTIEQNLIKADAEDKADSIRGLKLELEKEKEKSMKAESELKRIGMEMNDLSSEFSDFKDKFRSISGTPDSTQELVEVRCPPPFLCRLEVIVTTTTMTMMMMMMMMMM